ARRGGEPAPGGPPRVERTRLPEAEAASRGVELERADAEIQQHGVRAVPAFFGEFRGELGERILPQANAIGEAAEPLGGDGECSRGAVEAEEPRAGCGVQRGLRV